MNIFRRNKTVVSIGDVISPHWISLAWVCVLVVIPAGTYLTTVLFGRFEFFSKFFDLSTAISLQRIITFLYLLVVVCLLMKTRVRELFGGITIFIVVFWVLLSIRFIYSAIMNESPDTDQLPNASMATNICLALYRISTIILVCCIASCGVPKKFEKHSYWGVLMFLLLTCILLLIVYYPLLIGGISIRNKKELIALLKYLPAVKNDFFSIGNPSYFGMLLVLISFWGWCEGRIKSLFFFPIYTIGMIMITLAAMRSHTLGVICGILTIFLFAKPQKRLNFYIGFLVTLLIGVFLFYNVSDGYIVKRIKLIGNEFIWPADKEKTITMISDTISGTTPMPNIPVIFSSRTKDYLGTGRLRIWNDCVNKILENPITGYGFSPYKHTPIRQNVDYPDSEKYYDSRMRVGNSIIDAFLSTGIFGGVLFVIILLRAVMDAIVVCRKRSQEYGWIASIFLALVCSQMVEGSIYIRHYWFLAVALRAIVVLQINNNNNNNNIQSCNKKTLNIVPIIIVIIIGLLLIIVCSLITKNSPFKNLFNIPRVSNVQVYPHVEKIWDKANHNAFTDLIKYEGDFYLVFREGDEHNVPIEPIKGKAGCIRILKSHDGITWDKFDLIEMEETDLRDPSFQITSEGQLQCIVNGIFYNGGKLQARPFVLFMDDKNGQFTKPNPVIFDSNIACTGKDIIWKGDWYNNIGYFVVYHFTDWNKLDWIADIIKTEDGLFYSLVARITIPNDNPSETSIHIDKAGVAHILVRCDGKHKTAMYGKFKLPYDMNRHEKLYDTSIRMGGQDFVFLSEKNILICSRVYEYDTTDAQKHNYYTALLILNTDDGTTREILRLPSGGDTSYAGLVLDNDTLYIAYYSSHEQNKAAIYFTKIALKRIKDCVK
jgi:hypothetical protein